MKPIIGITTNIVREEGFVYARLNVDYIRSVAEAGGLPVLLPLRNEGGDPEAYIESIDGLLLSGGLDISPAAYGAMPLRQVNLVSSERDDFEMALARLARARGLPTLGICRGQQLLNVAFGGTLIQDIGAELPDAGGHYPEGLGFDEPFHYIDVIEPASRLRAALGADRLLVNSFHHQALRELAPGFRVTARSDDGIVEGIEAEEGYMVGVQFHPEGMSRRFPSFLGIFADLVRAAGGRGGIGSTRTGPSTA